MGLLPPLKYSCWRGLPTLVFVSSCPGSQGVALVSLMVLSLRSLGPCFGVVWDLLQVLVQIPFELLQAGGGVPDPWGTAVEQSWALALDCSLRDLSLPSCPASGGILHILPLLAEGGAASTPQVWFEINVRN